MSYKTEKTYWNGLPCEARRVRVIVADKPEVRLYWARPYVGQERAAVEVKQDGQVFYLDDEGNIEPTEEARAFLSARKIEHTPGSPGWGWRKVTTGKGSPQYGHASLEIERVL
jgi:hypothetical protein